MNSTPYEEYLAPCCALAKEAGELIMGYFTGSYTATRKQDASPVTDADIAANTLISNALKQLTPEIPVVGEEDEIIRDRTSHYFWLVDPLDGTRSFVSGEGEFTVNIALIEGEVPVLGVIYVPVTRVLYYACAGGNAWRQDEGGAPQTIHTRAPNDDGVVVLRSRSHASPLAQSFLDTLTIKQTVPSSSSIKFCHIAEGAGDVYPRFGRTMEWDTAAGHAIVNSAGGRVVTQDGATLRYGKAGYENPAFIAYGK